MGAIQQVHSCSCNHLRRELKLTWQVFRWPCQGMHTKSKLFAERFKNLPPEPISSFFDLMRLFVKAGGSAQASRRASEAAQVFHIGTSSVSEHTATERNGSSNFQSLPSQRTSSVPSHPTWSGVSFGPSTPFSLLSRSETLGDREQCMKFPVKIDHLPDNVRKVQTEIGSIREIYQAKCKSFCSCIKMSVRRDRSLSEFRITTSEPEFRVTWI